MGWAVESWIFFSTPQYRSSLSLAQITCGFVGRWCCTCLLSIKGLAVKKAFVVLVCLWVQIQSQANGLDCDIVIILKSHCLHGFPSPSLPPLSLHPSLSSITLSRSCKLHPVSAQSTWERHLWVPPCFYSSAVLLGWF